MCRAWLASHLLPSKFWWWALKRSVETSNYIPIRLNNKYTTPFYLVHHQKPDLRNLLPLFSVGYLTRYCDGSTKRQNMHSHTLQAILVGRDEKSNTYKFFHPGTQRTIVSDRFKLDEVLTSGPTFGLQYDGGFYFYKYSDFNDNLRPPRFKPEQTVFVTSFQPPKQGKIITIPTTEANIYTAQHDGDLSLHQYPGQDLLEYDPNTNPQDSNIPSPNLPTWIKDGAKAILFLHTMKKPQYGTLLFQNNTWLQIHKSHPRNTCLHSTTPLSTIVFTTFQRTQKVYPTSTPTSITYYSSSHCSAYFGSRPLL